MSFVRRATKALVGTAAAVALTIGLVPFASAEDAVAAAQAELTQLQTEAAKVERDLETSKQEQVTAQRQYDVTTADLDAQRVLVEQMRVQVGRVAVAAHQQSANLGAAALLFDADSEERFLSDMAVMQSVTAITDEQMVRLGAEQERLVDLEAAQADSLKKIQAEVDRQTELAAEYDGKVARAQLVVDRLSAEQKAALESAANRAIMDANLALLAGAEAEAASLLSRSGITLPVSGEKGVWPTSGPITSPFGYRVNPIGGYSELHDGTDIAPPCGTPVRASWTGVVLSARAEGGWGNRIIVDSGTYKAAYNHLQTMAVSPGEVVQAGQIIASVGTTGYSTGCHLHFSTWVNGQIVDPVSLF
ncbi:MAG: peptidoglycan DD-metalloendopeptidase family protein [Brooklawnia sp.]|nr:peptidoglycan DD-metalloendopeptidase family protein [Brooklawnia sp.]